jgi:hypothetical protein
MIFGVMPKFQQRLHAWGFSGFMCLLFAGLTFLGTAVFLAGLTGAGPNPVAYVLFGGFFAAQFQELEQEEPERTETLRYLRCLLFRVF